MQKYKDTEDEDKDEEYPNLDSLRKIGLTPEEKRAIFLALESEISKSLEE